MMEYRVPSQDAEILFRLCPSLPEFEWLKIQIDGSEVGQIGKNKNLKVRLPLGRHIITSDSYWGQRTSPLPISIQNAEDIEITIEPAAGSSKLQFVIESKLPVSNRLNERRLKSKKLAWDIGRQVILRKTNLTQLYFDMENIAFPYALRFLIDQEQQDLKVYASRRQELVLYYSQVYTCQSFTFPGLKINNGFEHTFFRSDGEFLGSLTRSADKWIISSKWREPIAEILEINKFNEDYSTRDHYLQSVESNIGVLAYKKLMPKNVLQFHNINFPRIEHSEILLLAFVTFSALTWNETPVYNAESFLIRV
jgi:hypothetical protein